MKKQFLALTALLLTSCGKTTATDKTSTSHLPDGPIEYRLDYQKSEDYEIRIENPSEDSMYSLSTIVVFHIDMKNKDKELVSVFFNDHEITPENNTWTLQIQAPENRLTIKTKSKPTIDENKKKTVTYVTTGENDCTFTYIPRYSEIGSTDYHDLYQRDFPIYSLEEKEIQYSFLPGDRIDIYKDSLGKNEYGLLTRFTPAKGSLTYEENKDRKGFYLTTEDQNLESKQELKNIIYRKQVKELTYSDYNNYKDSEVSIYYSDIEENGKHKVFGAMIL